MEFSTKFQLYRNGQCTYSCSPGVLFTRTPPNILNSVAMTMVSPRAGNSIQREVRFKVLRCVTYRDRAVLTLQTPSGFTSAEACKKGSRWLWKESCVSTGVRKPGNACASLTAMI